MANRNQEWFNQMVAGLAAQGWQQAYDEKKKQCVYLREDGCKCAVGQIIPPDAPVIVNKDFHGTGVYSLARFAQLSALGLGVIDIDYAEGSELDFLIAAQKTHDNCNPGSMRLAFERLAEEYNLVFPA